MYANEQLYYKWDCDFTSPPLPGDNEDGSNGDDNFLSVTSHFTYINSFNSHSIYTPYITIVPYHCI